MRSIFASWKPTPVRDILWLFLGTRLLLVVGTYLSFILFPVPPHVYPQVPVDLVGLLTSWNHWDAIAYGRIARYGYTTFSDSSFFPLFPLLIKALALVFGNRGYILAAMLISNLALLGTFFLLYQLATDALGEQVGRRTILYLCLFPTALFFFAGYNEALFLFFCCGTFLALRHQRWVLAGLLGLLAALTRSAGVLLALPYLYEVWIARDIAQPAPLKQLKGLLFKALPIALIPLGLLLYMAYCWRHFGNPLAFAAAEKLWGRQTTFPWVGLLNALRDLFFVQPFGSFIEAHILLDLSALLGFIVLTILGRRYLRTSYIIWATLLLLFMLSSSAISIPDPLLSNQRLVLEIFPGFIMLAALGIKHPRLHQAILISFPFLQAILAALFVLHHWIV